MQKDQQGKNADGKQDKNCITKTTNNSKNDASQNDNQTSCLQSIIIQMMKKTRKSSPLFKPIKKLKSCLQSIDQELISYNQPTKKLLVFHFGLGNDLDKEILLKATSLGRFQQQKKLENKVVILPGKSWTVIDFVSQGMAQEWVKENQFGLIMEEINEKEDKDKLGLGKQCNGQEGNEETELTSDKGIKTETKEQQKKDEINSKQIPSTLFYYKQVHHLNLTRLMIFFYMTPTPTQTQSPLIDIPNCPSQYKPNTIPGLHLIDEFISPQQQHLLLQWIDGQKWEKLSNRRVQHYGYEFKYGKNNIDKDQKYDKAMPDVFIFLLDRLKKLIFQLSGQYIVYDQLTINDYFAGHGIPAHFDTHSPFKEYFVALSMLSGIVMDWKKYDNTEVSTYLKQRSLVVFSGEARFAWLHSIACRKIDLIDNQLKQRSRRLSLTFRKIRFDPCQCQYYFYCDSQGYDQQKMKKNNPLLKKYMSQLHHKKLSQLSEQQIYQEYVIKAYNSFGYDFHNKIIPQVKYYLQAQLQKLKNEPQAKFFLDIGCGNGQYHKLVEKCMKIEYFGIERCVGMNSQVNNLCHMDGLNLAYRPDSFDIVIIVAVLHHLTTQEARVKCLNQAKKVMKNDGIMIVTVFSYQAKKDQYATQNILLDYCLPKHKVKQEENEKKEILEKQQGVKTEKGQIFTRYYHLFEKKEFQGIVEKSGLFIEEIKFTKENIVAKLRKNLNLG